MRWRYWEALLIGIFLSGDLFNIFVLIDIAVINEDAKVEYISKSLADWLNKEFDKINSAR